MPQPNVYPRFLKAGTEPISVYPRFLIDGNDIQPGVPVNIELFLVLLTPDITVRLTNGPAVPLSLEAIQFPVSDPPPATPLDIFIVDTEPPS